MLPTEEAKLLVRLFHEEGANINGIVDWNKIKVEERLTASRLSQYGYLYAMEQTGGPVKVTGPFEGSFFKENYDVNSGKPQVVKLRIQTAGALAANEYFHKCFMTGRPKDRTWIFIGVIVAIAVGLLNIITFLIQIIRH